MAQRCCRQDIIILRTISRGNCSDSYTPLAHAAVNLIFYTRAEIAHSIRPFLIQSNVAIYTKLIYIFLIGEPHQKLILSSAKNPRRTSQTSWRDVSPRGYHRLAPILIWSYVSTRPCPRGPARVRSLHQASERASLPVACQTPTDTEAEVWHVRNVHITYTETRYDKQIFMA